MSLKQTIKQLEQRAQCIDLEKLEAVFKWHKEVARAIDQVYGNESKPVSAAQK